MEVDKPDIQPCMINKIRQVAQHEAGHWIISRILGFKAGDINFKIDLNCSYLCGAEITLHKSLSNEKEIIDYLEKRLIILYAGIFAEFMKDGKVDKKESCENFENRAKNDHSKISELIKLLRNIKFKDCSSFDEAEILSQLNSISDYAINKTIDYVEKESYIINVLSEELYRKIKNTDVEYILEESDIMKLESIVSRLEKYESNRT